MNRLISKHLGSCLTRVLMRRKLKIRINNSNFTVKWKDYKHPKVPVLTNTKLSITKVRQLLHKMKKAKHQLAWWKVQLTTQAKVVRFKKAKVQKKLSNKEEQQLKQVHNTTQLPILKKSIIFKVLKHKLNRSKDLLKLHLQAKCNEFKKLKKLKTTRGNKTNKFGKNCFHLRKSSWIKPKATISILMSKLLGQIKFSLVVQLTTWLLSTLTNTPSTTTILHFKY